MSSVTKSLTSLSERPLSGKRVACISRGGRAPLQAARLLRDFGADVTLVAGHEVDGLEQRISDREPAIRRARVEDLAGLLSDGEHEAVVHEGPVNRTVRSMLAPATNLVELTWLGDDAQGTDAHAQAVAGPADVIGEPDREPLWFPHRMGEYILGANACAMVLLFTLREREGAVGQLALNDIWAYAAGTNGLLCTPKGIPYHREGRRSPGNGGVYPQRLFRAADGWIALLCRSRKEWDGILTALDSPAWGQDERYRDLLRMAQEYPDEVDVLVEAETSKHTCAELFRRAIANEFPLAPVRSPAEAMEDEYLTRQNFWSEQAGVCLPGPLWRAETWLPGAPTAAVGAGANARTPDSRARRPAAGVPDLTGLRVLDLSWVWAGPMTGSMLADLGADVIKVEHAKRLDNMRLRGKLPSAIPDSHKDVDPRETDPLFHNVNRGKRSIVLDMRHPDGASVFLRLVRESDVVLESFRPHVLDSWGLGYERLASVNPELVLLSLRGLELDERFGPSGLRSYAPITSSLSGLESGIRYEDADGPTGGMAIGISDPVAGWHGFMLLLAALLQARNTGVGGWIRLSQLETLSSVLPEMFIDSQAPGELSHVKSWAVRCRDGDVLVDAEADAFGRLAEKLGFDPAQRVLETDVSMILAGAEDLGLSADRVHGVADHANWTNRFGRPMLTTVEHALVGPEELYSHGWRIDGKPVLPTASAPTIGQDTQAVMREYAGMDDAEIARLEADNVLC